MEPKNIRVTVKAAYHREGSILGGDVQSFCDSVVTDVELESDEPPEKINQLIKMAEGSCFTMAALRNPVDVSLNVTVNGKPFQLD